jgi:hypothetical protein
MIRQTAPALVKSRDMTGRTQTLPVTGEEVKTTENQYIGPIGVEE